MVARNNRKNKVFGLFWRRRYIEKKLPYHANWRIIFVLLTFFFVHCNIVVFAFFMRAHIQSNVNTRNMRALAVSLYLLYILSEYTQVFS